MSNKWNDLANGLKELFERLLLIADATPLREVPIQGEMSDEKYKDLCDSIFKGNLQFNTLNNVLIEIGWQADLCEVLAITHDRIKQEWADSRYNAITHEINELYFLNEVFDNKYIRDLFEEIFSEEDWFVSKKMYS